MDNSGHYFVSNDLSRIDIDKLLVEPHIALNSMAISKSVDVKQCSDLRDPCCHQKTINSCSRRVITKLYFTNISQRNLPRLFMLRKSILRMVPFNRCPRTSFPQPNQSDLSHPARVALCGAIRFDANCRHHSTVGRRIAL